MKTLSGEHHDELVHEARKTVKRMRALARLLRYELDEQEFDRINDSLGDAGRRLSGSRDAAVRLATLERLRKAHPDALAGVGVERLFGQLREECRQASRPAHEQAVLREIDELRHELARRQLVEHPFKTLEPGLRRIYREGRERHKRARQAPLSDIEVTHDWRKRVKSLYYALDMLGASGAKGSRGPTRRARRLGETLGEEHDMWMLHSYVLDHPQAFAGNDAAQAELMALVERQRKRLHRRALSSGARLYRRNPRVFAKRVRKALTSP